MDASYNVVVIMCDELKAKALAPYALNPCPTPHIDALAAGGIRCDAAYTPHPLCVPARISFWTSMHSSTHGCMNNERLKPEAVPHAFSEWKRQGYRTGLIGKNHCFSDRDAQEHFDVWCEIGHTGRVGSGSPRGMDWVIQAEAVDAAHAERRAVHAPGHHYTAAATAFPEEHYATALIGRQAEAYILENRDRPFSLWISFPDPHPPYELPERFFDRCRKAGTALPPNAECTLDDKPERMKILASMLTVDREKLADFLAAYYGMIGFIDEAVGTITAALRTAGVEERTIVVFTADHGDFAGEYGMIAKGGLFCDALTRVPLILSLPGRIPSGYVERRPVSLIDVVPTLFSLQGIPLQPQFEGHPLPLGANDSSRAYIFSEYGSGGPRFTMEEYRNRGGGIGRPALIDSAPAREAEGCRKMIRDERYKYVHDPTGDCDELYDLTADPWETVNLAGTGDCLQVQERLHAALAARFFDDRPDNDCNNRQSRYDEVSFRNRCP